MKGYCRLVKFFHIPPHGFLQMTVGKSPNFLGNTEINQPLEITCIPDVAVIYVNNN